MIIGYGSLIRGDDATGYLAARELQRYFHDDYEIEVIAAKQLTPEMAEFVAESSFVLFVDASPGEEPGAIRSARVQPPPGFNGFTHHLTPASLVAAAKKLYGDAAPIMALTLTGWSFELADQLSKDAQRRLPELVRQAKEIVATYRPLLDLPNAVCSLAE
jgi:hydrogenase maturation protease